MRELEKTLQAAAIHGELNEITRLTSSAEVKVNEFIGDDYKHVGQFKEPTALTIATEHGHTECIKKILEIGKDVYGVKEFGNNRNDTFLSSDYFGAMILAASEYHFEVLQLLAEFRLLKDISDKHPLVEFVKVVKERQFHKFATLLNALEDKSFLKGWKGHNLLNLFLLHGCPPSCIQTMIKHGIGVNGWDLNGLTPLRCAILRKSLGCVKFLLEQGADVYAPHLLRHSHFRGDGTVVDDKGCELSPKNCDWSKLHDLPIGATTLMYAASVKSVPILQLMLEAAPKDIGLCQYSFLQGSTPLMFAIYYGDFESVSLLLDNYESRKTSGRLILKIAVSLGKRNVFCLLLQKITNWKHVHLFSGALGCIMSKNKTCLMALLDIYHKEFDETDAIQLLSSAIRCESVECAKLLIEQPCCSNIFTARPLILQVGLTYACKIRKYEFVKLLLEYGIDINFLDEYEMTLVMHAVHKNDVQLLEMLMDAHADLELVDCAGWTIFTFAMFCSTSCLKVLLKSGKLLDRDRLKHIHKSSFSLKCITGERRWNSERKNMINNYLLTMQLNIFEWQWCSFDMNLLKNTIVAAVTMGVSPGKFVFQNQSVSPLNFAVIKNAVITIQYILENLYFLPDDYQFLCSNVAQKFFGNCPQLSPLYKKLTHQPLSLSVWSFLTVSKALASMDEWLLDRSARVDSLQIPNLFKFALKFKDISFLSCSNHPI